MDVACEAARPRRSAQSLKLRPFSKSDVESPALSWRQPLREFAMRRAAVWKFAAVSGVAVALTAYCGIHLLAGAHRSAAFWLAVAILASGSAAKLTAPVTLFGQQLRLSAPLFLPVAALI